MEVSYYNSFLRDLKKIKDQQVKNDIQKTLLIIEEALDKSEIPQLRKLTNKKAAYRIRVGDYRIGVLISGNKIDIKRVEHRKNIYKIFPSILIGL